MGAFMKLNQVKQLLDKHTLLRFIPIIFFIIAIFTSCEYELPIAYFSDNFDDGKIDNWITFSGIIKIEKGELSIDLGNGVGYASAMHTFKTENDFTFEVVAKYISGDTEGRYGISIDPNEGDGHWYTWVTPNGMYFNTNESSWISAAEINTNPESPNILKIIKTGSQMTFFINGSNKFSTTVNFQSIGYISFNVISLSKQLHVHFDDVIAEEL